MQDPDTKSMFESEAKRLDMHSVLGTFFNNAEVEIVEDERIVNKALEYTLSTRSPQAARYVLHQWDNLCIHSTVTFEQIEDLMGEYPKTLDLLLLLVNYDVNFIETEEKMIEVTQRHRESIRTVVNKSWDRMKEESKQVDINDDSKEMESETELKPSISVDKSGLTSSPSIGYQIDYSHLPELQTAECG